MPSPNNKKTLYRQSQFPIFQNRMYDSEEEARNCPRGDILLVEDSQTGLVYNDAFLPELMVYDAHYQNEQGLSPLFQQHLRQVADIVGSELGRENLVEVGCGKGRFLELLQAQGFDITGFDPTYEGSNPAIRRHYFARGVGIAANGLILRHVLEHVQDPFGFLAQLREANGGKGRIYIEVPCFDWICEHRAWFDIFYEHVNYFRLADFHRMFGEVVASGRFFGDQYLYVVADLESLHAPTLDSTDPVRFPADFSSSISTGDMTAYSAIWGGGSKGVIFALLRERAGQPVTTVIDINPAKQGKYLPGTGLRVMSPEVALPTLPKGSSIYVMNSNYLQEIRAMSNNDYVYVAVDQ